jgi:hypothetical protein
VVFDVVRGRLFTFAPRQNAHEVPTNFSAFSLCSGALAAGLVEAVSP